MAVHLPAVDLLQIIPNELGFQVSYRTPDERQLQVHCWTGKERIKQEVAEVIELVPAGSVVRGFLDNTKSVIAVELGAAQEKDMGIVVAYEIARWFSQHKNGIIRGGDNGWLKTNQLAFERV